MTQKKHSPEFEAALEIVMGPILRPMLDVILKNVENVESKILNAPRTYRRRMIRDLENAGQRMSIDADPEEYRRSLSILIREAILHSPDMLQQTAQRGLAEYQSKFSTLPEHQAFDALANAAERVAPKEFEAALKKIDQEEIDHKMTLAAALLEHAANLKEELRAEYAIHATKRVSELLYQPFLRTVLRLFCAAEKKDPLDFYEMPYGQVLNQLKAWHFLIKYPKLLDEDAVLFRNAEAHEHWDYFDDTDEVEVWDQSKNKGKKKIEKRKRLSVDVLLERANRMAIVSGAMFPGYIRARYFMIFDRFADPLRKAIADLLSSDSQPT